MFEAENIVLAFIDAINSHDVEAICALMTRDHVYVDAANDRFQGIGMMAAVWDGLFRWFPDYEIRVEQMIYQTDKVAVFGSLSGTYAVRGELDASRFWEVPAAWKAVIHDNHVREWRAYNDTRRIYEIIAAAS
ncbi:MAG: nuclear transport factor 2 family protein [Anaerolineae bacterium]|nr:nuclear transport factor 2 family protein [Anaerolineae bacterium]